MAAVGYLSAYITLPRRFWDDGVRIVHVRVFPKDFQPYFFAPAGLIESLIIRVHRTIRPRERCGEVVVLRTQRVTLRFRATVDLNPLDAPLPWNTDILERAAQYVPGSHGQITAGDGSKVVCEYWDCDLDQAENFLRDKYPRPYTLMRTLRWYEETCDEATRIHLLTLLAASRDPRAALVVGGAITSTSGGIEWLLLRSSIAILERTTVRAAATPKRIFRWRLTGWKKTRHDFAKQLAGFP